jgi:hypothetical protein
MNFVDNAFDSGRLPDIAVDFDGRLRNCRCRQYAGKRDCRNYIFEHGCALVSRISG